MKKTILYIMASLFIFGCSQRLGDFSIMSTKNVDIGANYVKVEKNVQGKDMKPIYVVFPTGYPSIESAIDDALKKVNDSVIMTDVVLTYRYFYIPYVYGEYVFEVEGDVWKKENIDVGEMLDNSEAIYTAIEKNGEITLIKE